MIIVTGASGYLGSALCRALAPRFAVTGMYRRESARLHSLSALGVPLHRCDLADRENTIATFRAIGHSSTVIHCAAVLPGANCADENILIDNTGMAENVLAAATTVNSPLVIFCSSISIYGASTRRSEDDIPNPASAYGKAKLSAERSLHNWTTESPDRRGIVLRFSGIHGGDRQNGVIFRMLDAAQRGEPIPVAEPDSLFRICFIEDAVQAVEQCLRSGLGTGFHCFNVASGEACRLRDLASAIHGLFPQGPPPEMKQHVPARDETMPIAKICSTTGFRPLSLQSGLNFALHNQQSISP